MKKKEKYICLISLTLAIIATFTLIIPLINNIPATSGLYDYSIIFNNEKNIINETTIKKERSAKIKSEENNTFIIDYSDVVKSEGKWQKVNANGYFYTTKKSEGVFNNNIINGLKTLSFNFANSGESFTILFSYDGDFTNEEHYWKRNYTTIKGSESENQIIDFEAHPHYFKFLANNNDIEINSLTLTYDCSASEDETWQKKHGVIPLKSEDEKTFTYGLYPKDHINDSNLIEALEAKAASLGVNDEEYFWYNDEYYVKDKCLPFSIDEGYTFHDGTEIIKDTTYFFKCEALKWNIVFSDENKYIIDCSNIIYGSFFDKSSNFYAQSTLRNFLTVDFYYHAFFLNSFDIIPTDLDDVSVTGDTTWVGSKEQYESWYHDEVIIEDKCIARQKRVCDFALNNTSEMWEGEPYYRTNYYWTRTLSNYKYKDYIFAYDVYFNGTINERNITLEGNGVSPTITIKK